MRIFGLDLGISSIGWAVVEEKGKEFDLLNWGSRIFEPGMDGSIDDIQSGKGKSLCTNRRLKRALRVQYRRRRERREKIIALLTEFGLLPSPLTPAFFTEIDNRLLMTFPKEMRPRVAHVLPYLYRKKALDQPLRKDELGRALFHLAQRRGYKSNRKVDLKDSEETGVVQSDIDKLKADMAKAGARTLGEFFCTVDPEEERIRTRYTDRGMFEQELAAICKAQRHLVSEAQEERLAEAFFFQRKLKSNAGLVGACSIYPEEKGGSPAVPDLYNAQPFADQERKRDTADDRGRAYAGVEYARRFFPPDDCKRNGAAFQTGKGGNVAEGGEIHADG